MKPPVPAAGPWRRLGAQSMEADIRVTSECDLTITVDDGQSAAVPGEAVSYAITVSNPGTSAVAGAVVTDNLPAAVSTAYWSCIGSGGGACTASGSGDIDDLADLPVGASVTYTLDVTIDPSATGTLSNSASVSPPAGYVDTNPGDNTDTDIDTLTPEVDLAITKDDGRSHVVAGLGTTYTIVASNPGPSSVFGATVADVFPTELTGASWTCVGAGGGACTASGTGDIDDSVDLYAGGSVTYTTYASVDSGATGTVVNTATVSVPGGVTERDPVDNTDTDTDTIVVPLFADGFESGDTGRWSSATPQAGLGPHHKPPPHPRPDPEPKPEP